VDATEGSAVGDVAEGSAVAEAAEGSVVPVVGDELRLEIGPVAHGGHCVARHQGRVVFVRHALPGETVTARLTAASPEDRFWRADAVEVLVTSADRVSPPCPLAVPGGCGGCDWQHASLPAQRRLKADVVREQVRRLAGTDLADLVVEPVPGDAGGLGWRTRLRFTVDAEGRPGLRAHRSHRVVPVEDCLLAHPRVAELGVGRRLWPGVASVEVVAPPAGTDRLVVVEPVTAGHLDVPPLGAETALARTAPAGPASAAGRSRGEARSTRARRGAGGIERLRGRTWVEESVAVGPMTRRFRITGTGFWQVHPGAARTLLDAVLDAAQPGPGERALDLYSGVGLFAAGLAERVGPGGTVLAVESGARAVADARRALHDLPTVRLEQGRVEEVLPRLTGRGRAVETVDVAVLDPPRSGAGPRVVEQVLALAPRVVVYVACDPAALARDIAVAAGRGYSLAGLRAFDLFPMTHHVECVATLRPS